MESRYGLYSRGSSGWTSLTNEEFHEEDVWGVFKEIGKDSDPNVMTSSSNYFISKRQRPTSTRMIPIKSSNKNATSFEEPKIVHQSAPVNIPDWSKLYGTNSRNTSKNYFSEEEDGDEGYDEVVPPHELIAKKNQISSFSVCEGAGRTLKGRDLSRVRNAVLTKTSFLESNFNHY